MAYQDVRELLGNRPRKKLGEIAGPEIWWVERQQALERAGYMLRSRYRSDWTPSWAGTNKLPLNFEDGHRQLVSNGYPPTHLDDHTHNFSLQRPRSLTPPPISYARPV